MANDVLSKIDRTRGAWYETEEEIAAGVKWGREKARLLRWVRSQMTMRLTLRERRCVELYYFEGLTFREAAHRTETNATSVYRAVQRSLRKLRQAAAESEISNHPPRKRRVLSSGARKKIFP